MPTNRICDACTKTSGRFSTVATSVVQKHIPGTQIEVLKFACGDCGNVWHEIAVHDEPITEAEFDALALSFTNLRWTNDVPHS